MKFIFFLFVWGFLAISPQLMHADETIYLGSNSGIETLTGDAINGLTRYVDFGGDDDIYIIPTNLNGEVEMVDNQTSTIMLPEGLSIEEARFASDGVYLKTNGYGLTILGQPSTFAFVFAGDASTPNSGIRRDFTETARFFGASVPSAGTPPFDGTVSGIINADGNIATGDNQAPTASPRSIQVSVTDPPYIELPLSGSDPDGDTINFVLDSPVTGLGYIQAYIIPDSGRLFVSLDGSGASFNLTYRVSDGKIYSQPVLVAIEVVDDVDEEFSTGLDLVDAGTYGRFYLVDPYGDLFGAPGDAPRLPSSIDLSAQFPTPSNQGGQGSCVGWATAYAMKSYHERAEIGWELDRNEHLFSPSFVFNQIAAPGCNGSYISDALDLIKSKGAATLATMPYDDSACSKQPSAAAFAEAADFLLGGWGRLQTTAQVKAELANSKPVVIGMKVYDSFERLSGADPVYSPNINSERDKGGHAVTIAGYDDNRYGGAFRVINSWGARFGDNGYFWLPYNVFPDVVREAYSVDDAENTFNPDPVDPRPQPDELPNLQVKSWSANYTARPSGSGTLEWRVTNAGTQDSPVGVRVALMLSKNATFSTSDTLVIYEEIPFAIEVGHSAFRDEDNSIQFAFPDTLAAGTYYMAVWVDDRDAIKESNENDNVSIGGNQVDIENELADLVIESWYAEWNNASGDGLFHYKVVNKGKSESASDWDINLVLSTDQDIANSTYRYLFYEDVPYALDANRSVWRDESNPGHFNLFVSQQGNSVSPGTYYMAVWADDLNEVEESNERNNISLGRNTVTIGGARAVESRLSDEDETALITQEFNGKQLPTANALVRRVEIRARADGGMEMTMLDEPQLGDAHSEASYSKSNHAATFGIFPDAGEHRMP
ncbi:C1 family peptidase [Rhabdochromatium marinum]|uniref:C1 family peptidase n=1 Tax=Rhabdochromatium marinum TaxID=48729 RepID=UPI001908A223|nr:C1 family peptidase [Rhabdochromatium marinum]MBK1649729.1 hypothetical protein [Rhabdochromatium marinum]